MVGVIASRYDEFNGEYETSAFNCKINLNTYALQREEENYVPLTTYYDFAGNRDHLLGDNFNKINTDVESVFRDFME